MEISWLARPATIRIAVADGGGPAGMCGDERGRLVWADVRWDTDDQREPGFPDRYRAALRDVQAVLAARYPEAAIWFGQATMHWWATVGDPAGAPDSRLLTAGSPLELARLLGLRRARQWLVRPAEPGTSRGDRPAAWLDRVPPGHRGRLVARRSRPPRDAPARGGRGPARVAGRADRDARGAGDARPDAGAAGRPQGGRAAAGWCGGRLSYSRPSRSATAARNASVCWSTSALVVTGDISAMLWNGVMSTPRFIACRWK